MPFVLTGFIILLVSFVIALASLIREQSQRADFEAFDGDLSLNVEKESEVSENEFTKNEESVDLISKQVGKALGSEPSLAEYAPFPWEDPSLDLELGKGSESIAGPETLSPRLPVLGEDRDNLTGEISLSDLKKNFN